MLTERLVKIAADKQVNIKRKVNTMGGRVLELESDKIMEKGIEEGIAIMIENALHSTKSIAQTSIILKLNEEKVREIAKKSNISVSDL